MVKTDDQGSVSCSAIEQARTTQFRDARSGGAGALRGGLRFLDARHRRMARRRLRLDDRRLAGDRLEIGIIGGSAWSCALGRKFMSDDRQKARGELERVSERYSFDAVANRAGKTRRLISLSQAAMADPCSALIVLDFFFIGWDCYQSVQIERRLLYGNPPKFKRSQTPPLRALRPVDLADGSLLSCTSR